MAMLLSFARREPQRRGWNNDELAQFERIRQLLLNAGVSVEIERDVSDEGEPWCAFCSENGDVVIHVARIDGRYLFDSAALKSPITARSLNECAQRFIDDATLLSPRYDRNFTVRMHPNAMLAGVILTIFLFLEASTNRTHFGKTVEAAGADTPDSAVEGEDAANAEKVPDPEEGPEEGNESLLTLKLMLQQIAEMAAKAEEERTGLQTQAPTPGILQFVPMAAIVAAITFVKESDLATLPADGESVPQADRQFAENDAVEPQQVAEVDDAHIEDEQNSEFASKKEALEQGEHTEGDADLDGPIDFEIARATASQQMFPFEHLQNEANAEAEEAELDTFVFADAGFSENTKASGAGPGTEVAAVGSELTAAEWIAQLVDAEFGDAGHAVVDFNAFGALGSLLAEFSPAETLESRDPGLGGELLASVDEEGSAPSFTAETAQQVGKPNAFLEVSAKTLHDWYLEFSQITDVNTLTIPGSDAVVFIDSRFNDDRGDELSSMHVVYEDRSFMFLGFETDLDAIIG